MRPLMLTVVGSLLGLGCGAGPGAGTGLGTEGTGGTGGSATEDSSGGGEAPTKGSAASGESSGGDETGEGATTGDELPVGGPLLERIQVNEFSFPEGVKAGVNNWRIWGTGPLHVAPVFTVPLSSCGTLVGFTADGGGSLTPRVAVLDAQDALVTTLDLGAGLELRGLAAEADGHFGALLWDAVAQRIWVRRYDLRGVEQWSAELVNPDNTPTDFGIGDSRLEYGDGTYGAYYHVHSDTGHEGDTLKWVDAASGAESTGWGWGCSHSMSNLLRHNPGVGFLPACVTDCFPGTSGDFATSSIGGIYLNHNDGHVLDVDAGCNGDVAGELGGAALSPGGWVLVFNAHQAPATPGQSSYDPATMDQDIGLSVIGGGLAAGPVVWLTSTPDIDEDDASVARWQPADDPAEQYLVGWHEPGAEIYNLGRIDASGAWLEGPVDVSAVARWGRRDDPFRRHVNGDVMWSWFDDPGSTTLHVARVRSGMSDECAGG